GRHRRKVSAGRGSHNTRPPQPRWRALFAVLQSRAMKDHRRIDERSLAFGRAIAPGQPLLERLLTAIVDDDRSKARDLIKREPRLAICLVAKPRLYQAK